MNTKITVKNNRFGKGVYALRKIPAGEVILHFKGPIINAAQVLAMKENCGNPLQIDDDVYIDLVSPGVFVNHSCSPNAAVKDTVLLAALRDISPDEEITFDYSTTMSRVTWTMRCECGAPECRGLIGNFDLLPLETRKAYLRMGAVQGFIARDPARW